MQLLITSYREYLSIDSNVGLCRITQRAGRDLSFCGMKGVKIMAEFTNVAAQTVAANGNVVFSNTAVKGSNCIQHREGSGIITLRGLTNQCKARFFVDFSGNIAIPTGGTVEAISLAIAISGEPVLSSQMISTPAAVDQYNNVSSGIYIDVPRGCCVNIAVENTSDQAISVANANIVVTREA